MRRTKIIATVGPTCATYEQLLALVKAGVDIFRLNFSHGDHEWHRQIIHRIRRVNQKSTKNVAILLDTKGPEIRTTDVKTPIQVKKGQTLVLTVANVTYEAEQKLAVSYDGFLQDVEVGDEVLLDNGTINLKVREKTDMDVICDVLDSGEISSRRHINLPGRETSLESITPKDWEDIKFGIEQSVDFIALSFVRRAEDVKQLQDFLADQKSHIQVIAKIESFEATKNLESLCRQADAVMIARGDLGAEVPFSLVPQLQRQIIRWCELARTPVIVATHMLESMIENPIPTRAEVTDISEAVWQRADTIMLSAETANGKYPLKSVESMDKVAQATETEMLRDRDPRNLESTNNRENLVAAASNLLQKDQDIEFVLVITRSGHMAQLISSLRPRALIHAFTNEPQARRKMQILWGVCPHRIDFSSQPETTIQRAESNLLKQSVSLEGKKYILISDFLVCDRFVPTLQIRTLKK